MWRYSSFLGIFFVFFLCSSNFTSTEATIHSNPNGNITIMWDLLNWTPDGYVTEITIYNYQTRRGIKAPGWKLGWKWAKQEVIWATIGSRSLNRGNCSSFEGNIPLSCTKTPTIVDLKPGTPYNKRVDRCCRGGVLAPWSLRHQSRSISAFQMVIGRAGNDDRTVKLPKKLAFKAPGGGYTCGPAKVVSRSRLVSKDKTRVALLPKMTWKVTCSYSSNRKSPTY